MTTTTQITDCPAPLPLTGEDFQNYDSYANGKLELNDFPKPEKRKELSLRLAFTRSLEDAGSYLSSLSSGMKSEVAKDLDEILQQYDSCFTADDKKRIASWQQNELKAQRLYVGFSVSGERNASRSHTATDIVSGDSSYREDYTQSAATVDGEASTWITLLHPFQKTPWRFEFESDVEYGKTLGDQETRLEYTDADGNELGSTVLSYESHPDRITESSDTSLKRNDEKLSLQIEQSYSYNANQNPDSERQAFWTLATVSGSNFVPKWSGKLSGEYFNRDYTPTEVPGKQDRDKVWIGGYGELGWHPNDKFALFSEHEGGYNVTRQSASDTSWVGYEGWLIPHRTFAWGYLRGGLGGSYGIEEYQSLTLPENTRVRYGSVQGQVKTEIRPATIVNTSRAFWKSLTVTPSLEVKDYYLEGSLNGWSPQARTLLDLRYAHTLFDIGLEGYYGLRRRTLYFIPSDGETDPEGYVDQSTDWYGVSLSASVHPVSLVEASLSANTDWTDEGGFRPTDEWGANVKGSASVTHPKHRGLKFKAYGGANFGRSTGQYEPSSASESNSWYAGGSLIWDDINLKK